MKQKIVLIFFLSLIILSGCKEETRIDYMTNQKAADYFASVEAYCSTEKAQLWGTNLFGPIMIVNPETRHIYASHQDAEGLLKPKDGIFVGNYPKERITNIIAVTYGGTQYGMVRLSSRGENAYNINTGAVHALFHCFQENNEIDTWDYDVSHLNERTARLWVKLEWKALQRAIRTSGDIRTQALRDALVFRSARREMYPQYIQLENYFENYEGITRFTSTLICTDSKDECVRQLLNYSERVYNYRSYSNTWGFLNGAFYSQLLYESDFDFTTITTRDFDLGEIARERYNIELPDISRDIAGSLAFNYDIDNINQEEQKREADLKEGIRQRVSKYTEKPVIYLELESPYFSYDPGDMDIVDTLGTIYNTLRVTDNWGKVSIEDGGCLVSPNLDFIRIPAKNIEEEKNHITGEGWHIILNESWKLVPIEANYVIRKLIP
ncbi:MAG: hypothetical protein QNK33_09505 [Bacteroidales bacterium]|nr:hypothetical protein [Bacteroidales bacterium]